MSGGGGGSAQKWTVAGSDGPLFGGAPGDGVATGKLSLRACRQRGLKERGMAGIGMGCGIRRIWVRGRREGLLAVVAKGREGWWEGKTGDVLPSHEALTPTANTNA